MNTVTGMEGRQKEREKPQRVSLQVILQICTTAEIIQCIMNGQWVSILREATLAHFKVLSWHLLGKLSKNTKKLRQPKFELNTCLQLYCCINLLNKTPNGH